MHFIRCTMAIKTVVVFEIVESSVRGLVMLYVSH